MTYLYIFLGILALVALHFGLLQLRFAHSWWWKKHEDKKSVIGAVLRGFWKLGWFYHEQTVNRYYDIKQFFFNPHIVVNEDNDVEAVCLLRDYRRAKRGQKKGAKFVKVVPCLTYALWNNPLVSEKKYTLALTGGDLHNGFTGCNIHYASDLYVPYSQSFRADEDAKTFNKSEPYEVMQYIIHKGKYKLVERAA